MRATVIRQLGRLLLPGRFTLLSRLFLGFAVLFSPHAFAADAAIPFAPTLTQEQPQQVPQFETGKVDPGQAPKPPMKTRTESTAMAAAMEAQAAAMSQIACYKMMQEAMKKDDKEMMAMASMMCAQAAQQQMAAAQNKRNNDKMKEAEPGKAATMELGKFKMPEPSKDESMQKMERGVASSESPSGEEISVADTPAIPSFVKEKAEEVQEVPPTTPVPVEGSSVPNGIEIAKLGYDESGKTGSLPTPARDLPAGTSVATAKPGAGAEAANKTTPEDTGMGHAHPKTRGKGSVQDGEGGGGSGGGDEAKSDEDSPLSAMLAMLNGGGQGETIQTAPGEDLVNLTGEGGAETGKPAPNIFEYATYRYKKATFDEGKIKTKKSKPKPLVAPPIVTTQASVTP